MKNLIRHMIYQQLMIHCFFAFMLLCVLVVSSIIGGFYFHISLGLYFLGIALMIIIKPFSMLNFKWLNVLPLTRRRLLSFVFFEAIVTLFLGLLITFVLLLFDSKSELFLSNVLGGVKDLILTFSKSSSEFVCYTFLTGVVISPFFIIVQSFPVDQAKVFRFANMTQKQKIYTLLLFLVLSFGFILMPILTITFISSVFFGELGYRSLRIIFPMRKHRKWAFTYCAAIVCSIFLQFFLFVEVSTQKEMRPFVRMNFYGQLAPGISREAVFELLANPHLNEEARSSIVFAERDRMPSKADVSSDELQKWSRMAPNDHSYFHGLSMFHGKVLSAKSLIQLELDLTKRCSSGLNASKWVSGWTCLSKDRIRSRSEKALKIWFSVKDDQDTLNLLSEEHPLITIMLIKAALWSSANDSWKTRIVELSKSSSLVVSQYATMWLDRLKVNPGGIWDCTNEIVKYDSVCIESETVRGGGVRFESKSPGDAGAWLSLYIQN